MIRNTVLVTRTYYYPLGNTTAVCLTQDLPPEQNADILLLGCGDARNILFTCYADTGRKLDVTCCDIEPGIHARNILLYSLLIEDKENCNIERIWNIYFHCKLNKTSVELLESQSQKLVELSKSIEHWNNSLFGSSLRFCDERSLSLVRSYWMGFPSRGLSTSQKKDRQTQMQTTLDRAKTVRKKILGKHSNMSDLRATSPAIGAEALTHLDNVSKLWWDQGTTPSSAASAQTTELNPTFLFSPNPTLTLHYGLSPIVGFPLCSAYIPITKESPFHCGRKLASSAEHLVDAAKSHFTTWAAAFRRSIENKSVIRVFCGDALAFCCTLRHCQLTMPAPAVSMNLFCDNWTNSPLKLHEGDYGSRENCAPLSFDIVDTSNLVDHLGPLNMFGVTSSLLKFNETSSLYTEMLVQHDPSIKDRLSSFFGVDARAMALLFGLILPDLFTNATDSFDSDILTARMARSHLTTQLRSRLRWRRIRGCQALSNAPCVRVEAKPLAKLLNQVHDAMFSYEDPGSILDPLSIIGAPSIFSKQANLCYNRASFAFLLNLLKTTVATDWDQCIADVYRKSFCLDSMSSIKTNCAQDLLLHMHMNGVDNGEFDKPSSPDSRDPILKSVLPLPENDKVPGQLCVTVRVAREKLKIFTERSAEETGTPALVCIFEGADPHHWVDIFSSVQISFGKWRERIKEGISYPYIEEDRSQLFGSSDMFVSVYVPTAMLLQSKQFVPIVRCGIMRTTPNFMGFMSVLGPELVFASNKMTDKDVFITRFMPGMFALPALASPNVQQESSTPPVTVLLTDSGPKVVQRQNLECPEAKTKLADPASKVEIKFRSPFTALVSIGNSFDLKFEFPVPVSPAKHKLRIARKSSYLEVQAPLFHPLEEDAAVFIFPTFMVNTVSGTTEPLAWTSTRLDLDALPSVEAKERHSVALGGNASLMFSERERSIHDSNSVVDTRTDLKDVLCSIFMLYSGDQGQQAEFFGLGSKENGNQILMIPSSLRLDLVNHTFVLDTAVITLTEAMFDDPAVVQFLQALTKHGVLYQIKASEDVIRAWKALMPALVERCRTAAGWKHVSSCEYLRAGEIPLTKGVNEACVPSICSCGIGKFPAGDYLKSQIEQVPELRYMVGRYATRAAIGPIFVVPYIENCSLQGRVTIKEKCKKCGKSRRDDSKAGEEGLLVCSRCKHVKYCSKECQKADWKLHKSSCKTG